MRSVPLFHSLLHFLCYDALRIIQTIISFARLAFFVSALSQVGFRMNEEFDFLHKLSDLCEPRDSRARLLPHWRLVNFSRRTNRLIGNLIRGNTALFHHQWQMRGQKWLYKGLCRRQDSSKRDFYVLDILLFMRRDDLDADMLVCQQMAAAVLRHQKTLPLRRIKHVHIRQLPSTSGVCIKSGIKFKNYFYFSLLIQHFFVEIIAFILFKTLVFH